MHIYFCSCFTHLYFCNNIWCDVLKVVTILCMYWYIIFISCIEIVLCGFGIGVKFFKSWISWYVSINCWIITLRRFINNFDIKFNKNSNNVHSTLINAFLTINIVQTFIDSSSQYTIQSIAIGSWGLGLCGVLLFLRVF